MEIKEIVRQEVLQNFMAKGAKTTATATSKMVKYTDDKLEKLLVFDVTTIAEQLTPQAQYTVDQWTQILRNPENIKIRSAAVADQKAYFTEQEVKDNVSKILSLFLDGKEVRIPLVTKKDQTTNDYYSDVFVEMSNNFYKFYSLNAIKDGRDSAQEVITKLSVLNDSLASFDTDFRKMDRDAGSFWRPDNPKRYDNVRGSLNECLRMLGLTRAMAKNYLEVLDNILPVIAEYSNFIDLVSSRLPDLKIDSSFNLQTLTEKEFYLFGWITLGTNFFAGVATVGMLGAALGPLGWIVAGLAAILLIIGSIDYIINSISAANDLMDWYENTQKKLDETTKNLNELYGQLSYSKRLFDENWIDFQSLANSLKQNDLPVNNGDQVCNIFKLYIGSFNERLIQEKQLFLDMANADGLASLVLIKSKRIIDDKYPYRGEPDDDDEKEVWLNSNSNKIKSLAFKWLLEGYAKAETDAEKRHSFEVEIDKISDHLSHEELNRLLITSVFVHAASPEEVLKEAKFNETLVNKIRFELIQNLVIAA
ncbi:hypothetical protein [Flavobacterium sp. T12S277]|uniref:hypothetical protein n=1 Tax=Flavobacterium sp. T12S277 TaxID=3402752 RepID=UPI003ADA455E